ncbi:MAG: aspartate 1-decarboxylase [Thaumarchaeota archaeon]|nr:aspartate 1-decarboxylase [Nitrososphaerota archaeon]
MLIHMLKSKIHRVVVTDCNLNYEGSLTLDQDLMEAAGLIEWEKILVLNINNGERLETYVIKGNRGSGEVVVNGAAARSAQKGDLLTIMAFSVLKEEEAEEFRPKKINVDRNNKVIRTKAGRPL